MKIGIAAGAEKVGEFAGSAENCPRNRRIAARSAYSDSIPSAAAEPRARWGAP
jgi:hypothetical protein